MLARIFEQQLGRRRTIRRVCPGISVAPPYFLRGPYDRSDPIESSPDLQQIHGSFSTEHGIGRLKRSDMKRYCDPLELELMARVKAAIDPNGIMNPVAVVDCAVVDCHDPA
ncbi:MAG: hypothetical protein GKR94_03810 [Gammaproteobacteria bacterium]|nr:hypothetical protein [Gammaproteobacteria bacterium]